MTLSLDDSMLDAIDHALGTCRESPGGPLVGGEFTLPMLLDFYSGYDPSKSVLVGHGDPMGLGIEAAPIYEYPDSLYTRDSLIRALVDEVRRLRAASPADEETGR